MKKTRAGSREPSATSAASSSYATLQRACACGAKVSPGTCSRCESATQSLQRRGETEREPGEVPPVVYEALRSPGHPLDSASRQYFESRFRTDFGHVRVHTDSLAGRSALATNARAYSVGSNVVFADGAYEPFTTAGASLLAHELTHVAQVGSDPPKIAAEPVVQVSENSMAEGEAGRIAESIFTSPRTLHLHARVDAARLSRQPMNSPPSSVPADVVRVVRIGAFVRTQIAYERLAGIGPPPPPGRVDPAEMWRSRARVLVQRVFGEELNMDQVTEVVGRMRSFLGPALEVVASPGSDSHCRSRAGYVRGRRQPVYLCPGFFQASADERVRTMIHEAAHLSGIGEALGESYCPAYDCESRCGGFDVADAWSHFVHCLSGQQPDQGEVVEGRP